MPSDDAVGERFADFLDSIGLEDLTDDYRDENRAGDGRLADAFDPLPSELAELPEVSEVDSVNTHRDGDDVLVPVIPVLFEGTGEPDRHRDDDDPFHRLRRPRLRRGPPEVRVDALELGCPGS